MTTFNILRAALVEHMHSGEFMPTHTTQRQDRPDFVTCACSINRRGPGRVAAVDGLCYHVLPSHRLYAPLVLVH